jgi:hypothetical protein
MGCADGHRMRRRSFAPYRSVGGLVITLVVIGLSGCAFTGERSQHAAITRFEDVRASWPVVVETARVIVCSDGSREDAELHARWMERTIEEFERFTHSAGWPTEPLDEPLTAMLFSRQDDLRAFALRHDRVNVGATSGYYSPRNDWVVMNVGPSSSMADDGVDGLAARSEGRVLANPQAGLALRSDEAEAAHQHGSPAAQCVHETIHQLMFRSGLMDRRVTYPLWIAEGIATAFETDDPLGSESFGPDVGHDPRVEGFQQMVADGRVIALREFVSVTNLPRAGIDMHDFYNQSYALTTWLCRERPEAVLRYLVMLREAGLGGRSPRAATLFELAFGTAIVTMNDLAGEPQRRRRRH